MNLVSIIKNGVFCCVIFKFETICQISRYLAQNLTKYYFVCFIVGHEVR